MNRTALKRLILGATFLLKVNVCSQTLAASGVFKHLFSVSPSKLNIKMNNKKRKQKSRFLKILQSKIFFTLKLLEISIECFHVVQNTRVIIFLIFSIRFCAKNILLTKSGCKSDKSVPS